MGPGKTSQTISREEPRLNALQYQTSAYGLPFTILFGTNRIPGNLIWYGDFTAIPHTTTTTQGGGAGGKGFGVAPSTEVIEKETYYTYTVAVMMGLCEGIVNQIRKMWIDKQVVEAANVPFTLFTGTSSQTEWSYTAANHPSQALAYRKLAYAAASSYDLGRGSSLPNHTFEITGLNAYPNVGGKTFTVDTGYPLVGFSVAFSYSRRSVATSSIYLDIAAGHGLTDNRPSVRVTSSGSYPSPLIDNVTYWAIIVDEYRLSLAATPGGSPILFTSAGSGTLELVYSTNTFNSTAHGFAEGATVRATTTGTLPEALELDTDYVVTGVTANSFQLVHLRTGQVISPLDSGTGTHTLVEQLLDANPKDVITELLTNTTFGANFPVGGIGNWTQYSNYCIANRLVLSPALQGQRACNEWISELLEVTNSEAVWSEAVLKIVPYGDVTVTDLGVTFTPNITPLYNLTDDDFLPYGKDPVRVERKSQADAYNHIQVEYLNRYNDYNIEIAEVKDDASIEQFGLRPESPKQYHSITTTSTARKVAQLRNQRVAYIRNEYRFRLGWRYALLEPMDIVTLTDSKLGMSNFAVRILTVEEESDDAGGELLFTAEEFPAGLGTPALYTTVESQGALANFNVVPKAIDPPIIFNGPGRLTVSGYELWMGIYNSDPMWGGCEIWISYDGSSYDFAGVHNARSRIARLQSTLPVAEDPDITNIIELNTVGSNAEYLSVTQAEVDDAVTLCYMDTEFLAYRDATLVGPNAYELNYIRRGLYNTAPVEHPVGSPFIRLDNNIFKTPFDPDYQTKTVYFKFLSFNIFGKAKENIADVGAYEHLIGYSPTIPGIVERFAAGMNGDVVLFNWVLLDEPGVAGYEIRYTDQGLPNTDAEWNDAIPVSRVTKGTQITTVNVIAGDWTFHIRAIDKSGIYSRLSTTYDLTVTSAFVEITRQTSNDSWLGLWYTTAFGTASSPGAAAGVLDLGDWNGQAAPYNITGDYTLEYYGTIGDFYTNFANTSARLLGWNTAPYPYIWLLVDNGTSIRRRAQLIFHDGVTQFAVTAADQITFDKKHHLVARLRSNMVTFFIDGIQDSGGEQAASNNGVAATSAFLRTGGTANRLDGCMTYLRIWSRALTIDEINDKMDRFLVYAEETGLEAQLISNGGAVPVDYTATPNSDITVASAPVTPLRLGPVSGLGNYTVHPAGVLVPDTRELAAGDDFEVFDNPYAEMFDNYYYYTPEFGIGFDDNSLRVTVDSSGTVITDTVGSYNPDFGLDYRLAADAYTGYEPWVQGLVTARYMKGYLHLLEINSRVTISQFEIIVDKLPHTEEGQNVAVAAIGTTFTFAQRFHFNPSISIGVNSGTALLPTFDSVLPTSFDGHVFNLSGVEVGGTIDWSATGV